MEEWRPIKGFENFYEVSSEGRVRSMPRLAYGRKPRWLPGKLLKGRPQRGEYLRVQLSMNSVVRGYGIHQLVAQMFVPNPNHLPMVNHKNFDRRDNRAENLEWCSARDNIHFSLKHGRYSSERRRNAKLTYAKVSEIRRLRHAGLSAIQLAESYNVTPRSIRRVVAGERWKLWGSRKVI